MPTGQELAPQPTPKTYNDLFERFVDTDSSPLRGLVAYGLYKRAKREFMQRHCREHNNTPPTSAETAVFTSGWNEGLIEGKQIEAERVLQNFARFVIDDATDQIEADAIEREKPKIERAALRHAFWHEVWAGIVVAVLWTFALIIITLGLKLGGLDVAHFYEGLGSSVPPLHP